MRQLSSRSRRLVRCVEFAAVALLATVPSVWAQGQIFVTNYGGNSITVYSRKAVGDVAPTYTILGQLGDGPHQIAINHRSSELIVANNLPYSVAIYDSATGVRKRTIAGPSTGLNRPTGVAVDEINGEIYIANDFGSSITVYDVEATGDASPKRSIQSSYLAGAVGIAIDLTHDELVVAGYGYHSIATFDRLADGVPLPKRVIVGPATALNKPQGIALDLISDEILVANSNFFTPDFGAILAFPRTGDGDVAPIRRLEGSATQLCNPISVALDLSTNELVVANSDFGAGSCSESIATYARTAEGNVVPKRLISGALTELGYPVSAAITSASSLTVKVRATQSNVAAGTGVSYTITATANGGPVFNVSLDDTLPAGLNWSVAGPDAASCSFLAGGKLTCYFGNLTKGTTKTIQASAISTTASCPGISNLATASYNDGTAVLTASSQANITVKCR
jgi:DNA-binding beta-propeller fold protein YncE